MSLPPPSEPTPWSFGDGDRGIANAGPPSQPAAFAPTAPQHWAGEPRPDDEMHPTDWIEGVFREIFQVFANIVGNMASDPLGSLMDLSVLVVCCATLVLLSVHWRRIYILLTGDNIIHIDVLEVVSRCFYCFFSSGESCRSCFCGVNVVKRFGQWCGFVSTPVVLSHLTVGDLPLMGRHDLYLSIQCKTDPEIRTSVADMRQPYCVQFPERLVVNIRMAVSEYPLVISVMAKKAIGFQTICTAEFAAGVVAERCKEQREHHARGMRRYMMSARMHGEVPTPPWIMVRFSYLSAAADAQLADQSASLFDPTSTQVYDELTGEGMSVAKFKREFPLTSTDGVRSHELPEREVHLLSTINGSLVAISEWTFRIGFVTLLLFTFAHAYVNNCSSAYRELAQLEIANRSVSSEFYGQVSAAPNYDQVDQLRETCGKFILEECTLAHRLRNHRKSIDHIREHSSPWCCPLVDEFNSACATRQAYFMGKWVHRHLGPGTHFFSCDPLVCSMEKSYLIRHDSIVGFAMGALLLLALVAKGCSARIIRSCTRRAIASDAGNRIRRLDEDYAPPSFSSYRHETA